QSGGPFFMPEINVDAKRNTNNKHVIVVCEIKIIKWEKYKTGKINSNLEFIFNGLKSNVAKD
ncbi:hypothetical protein MO867_08185, partial [Microbulbifer sp. OS29]